MKLSKKQTQATDIYDNKTHSELVYGGAAGGGKSAYLAYQALKNCYRYEGSRWLLGRAKLKTLKETTLKSVFEVAAMQGLKNGVHFRYHGQSHAENPNTLEFSNGSLILLKDLFYYPSDPQFDELGSLEVTGAFIDECNQITAKAKQIVGSRIRYKLDEFNLIPKTLGTCNPAKNWVYDDFYDPWRKGKLLDYRCFLPASVYDNPHISEHYIRNLEKLDPVSRARLLDGNWDYDDDPLLLIDYEKAVDLFTNEFIKGTGKHYITCDVARLGKDSSKFRVWDGLRSIHSETLTKERVPIVAKKIKELQNRFNVPNSRTIADEDGVGGGVVDLVGCKGFVGNSKQLISKTEKNPKNYANLRAQCYFKLADVVNNNEMFLHDQKVEDREQIVKELSIVKQTAASIDGKLTIVKKSEMKQFLNGNSPDNADELMMRMYFEVAPPPLRSYSRIL